MIKKIIVAIIAICCCANLTKAQNNYCFAADIDCCYEVFDNNLLLLTESVASLQKNKKNSIAFSFAIPSMLISYGIVTRLTPCLQDFDHKIGSKIKDNVSRKYTFDDYIQYAPYAGVFGLDLCKVRAKHSFLERTLITASSALIAITLVTCTKYTTQIKRPDGSNFHSFPSGHTATAFLGAHILFREYQEISPFIGIAGYATAFVTGTMRMINKKHWLSDVITGAGIGILSAELSYLLLPVWHKIFKIKPQKNDIIIVPAFSLNQITVSSVCIF